MRTIGSVPTKFSGDIIVYVDTDRDEVVVRDAHGGVCRLARNQNRTLQILLNTAAVTLNVAAAEAGL